MRRPGPRLAAALLAVGAATAVLTSSAAAIPDRPDGISDAAWEDLQAQIARGEIEPGELEDRIAMQERAAPIVTDIATRHADTFAVSELRDDATAHLYFTGDVPADVVDELAAEPGIVAHGGAAYDAGTAESIGVAVHMALVEHLGAGASTVTDPVSGEINVEVASQAEADAIEEHLASGALDLDGSSPTPLDVDEAAVIDSIVVQVSAAGRGDDLVLQPATVDAVAGEFSIATLPETVRLSSTGTDDMFYGRLEVEDGCLVVVSTVGQGLTRLAALPEGAAPVTDDDGNLAVLFPDGAIADLGTEYSVDKGQIGTIPALYGATTPAFTGGQTEAMFINGVELPD
ncbi:hypothetical protein ACPYO6_09725 [Georgenia sp. Z1344]|uniref:hypothetical protein n=1 Tax=Georgenia sp. Z1344 TaxID=3416706 RepID=UPI003CF082E3